MRLALVLLAVLAAGCASPSDPPAAEGPAGAGGAGHGAAGCTLVADWTEPGLFGRLATAAPRDGVALARVPPPPGIPFEDAALASRWRAVSLLQVEHEAGEGIVMGAWRSEEEPEAGVRVHAGAPGGTPAGRVEAAARDFLRRIGEAPDEEAWLDAFLGSRREGESTSTRRADGGWDTTVKDAYEARFDGPFRAEALWAELSGSGAPELRAASLGRVEATWPSEPAWRATLGVHRDHVALDLPAGRAEAWVDGADHVHLRLAAAAPPTDDEVRAGLRAAFARAGLPEPVFSAWRGERALC